MLLERVSGFTGSALNILSGLHSRKKTEDAPAQQGPSTSVEKLDISELKI